jgi:hypothetical protein
MTRPSPRPRPKPVAKLGVEEPKNQITHCGHKFLRSDTPTGFMAALACKTGIGMLSQPESDDAVGGDAA